MSHRLPKVDDMPDEWVVSHKLQFGAEHFDLLGFDDLLILPSEVGRHAHFSSRRVEPFLRPSPGLVVNSLMDQDQSSFQFGVLICTVHGITTMFKFHFGELLAVFVFRGICVERTPICVVIPEEASFEKIFEWLELHLVDVSNLFERFLDVIVEIGIPTWLGRFNLTIRMNTELLFELLDDSDS